MMHGAGYVSLVKGQKAIRGAHKSLTKQDTLKRMKLTQLCQSYNCISVMTRYVAASDLTAIAL